MRARWQLAVALAGAAAVSPLNLGSFRLATDGARPAGEDAGTTCSATPDPCRTDDDCPEGESCDGVWAVRAPGDAAPASAVAARGR